MARYDLQYIPEKLDHRSLGKRKRRHGWCTFCQKVEPLKRTPFLGYLCPVCGGHLMANAPEVDRHFYRG